MGRIEVIKSGFFTTIQDTGRPGYLRFGIPLGGAIDDHSAWFGNWLVGNKPHMPVLEFTFHGVKLLFHDPAQIAVTGAPSNARINGLRIPVYRTLDVSKGDVIELTEMSHGVRSYLSIGGGFDGDYVFQSASTYPLAHIGGYQGRALESGDQLNFQTGSFIPIRRIPEHWHPHSETNRKIRIIQGPEWDTLGESATEQFLGAQFKVSHQSDRMGIRLEGDPVKRLEIAEIISSPVIPGIIQIPHNGIPLIILRDGQTAGGYPRIANVIQVDMSYVAQLKPHDPVAFQMIDIARARKLFLHRQQIYQTLIESVE